MKLEDIRLAVTVRFTADGVVQAQVDSPVGGTFFGEAQSVNYAISRALKNLANGSREFMALAGDYEQRRKGGPL